MTIYPVILAGGRGTRLWPLSRADRPKQFLSLYGGESLFRKTLRRHAGRPGVASPVVVAAEDYRFAVADEITHARLSDVRSVMEPCARNTGPAIAAAALTIAAEDPQGVLLVLPSDHLVTADDAYFAAIEAGVAAARAGRMVTFGVHPTYPETGYGYIAAGAKTGEGAFSVARFVEKPPLEEAARLIAEGGHYWNAGVFALSATALVDELAACAPDVLAAARTAVDEAVSDGRVVVLAREAYERAPEISIDYALFERTRKATVVPLSSAWSDVGSWRAFWQTLERDEAGVATVGDTLCIDTKNALVMADGAKVVTLGVEDLAIVSTPDSVLVAHLDRTQDVKEVVARLKRSGDTVLCEESRTALRPWGGYTSVMKGSRFQVKHLFVAPGKRLSLQKHHHRSEHWVVVRGTAEVTIDEKEFVLTENESVYIPLGSVHRLANPGRMLLELIEVQTGSYLEEDDIVRLLDEYGRR